MKPKFLDLLWKSVRQTHGPVVGVLGLFGTLITWILQPSLSIPFFVLILVIVLGILLIIPLFDLALSLYNEVGTPSLRVVKFKDDIFHIRSDQTFSLDSFVMIYA